MNPVDRLVVALDVPDLAGARALATTLSGKVGVFKVGLEQFVAHGPAAVEAARAGGASIFLDLKIHDIPRTAAAAVRSAGTLGVRFTTLHALGGREMIAAAREAAEACGAGGASRPQLLAVTVLTSFDESDMQEMGMTCSVADLVYLRARKALEIGCDGVISSGLEAAKLRDGLGDKFLIVTPGIRPGTNDVVKDDDQKRIASAYDAIRNGADYVVVGRPIRNASDPVALVITMQKEIAAALAER